MGVTSHLHTLVGRLVGFPMDGRSRRVHFCFVVLVRIPSFVCWRIRVFRVTSCDGTSEVREQVPLFQRERESRWLALLLSRMIRDNA